MRELVPFVDIDRLNEFGAVGFWWAGDKSRCRENVENVVVVIDNVSRLPGLAQDTPYMRAKPLHRTMRTLLLVS